jgi:hypothetical protein
MLHMASCTNMYMRAYIIIKYFLSCRYLLVSKLIFFVGLKKRTRLAVQHVLEYKNYIRIETLHVDKRRCRLAGRTKLAVCA